MPQRRARVRSFALGLVVVVLAAAVAVALVATGADTGKRGATGARVPIGARSTARLLGADSIVVQRSALTPVADQVLPAGWIFPSGTTVRLIADSWHASGAYANASATVVTPGAASSTYEVGFMREGSQWRVTFAEPAP